jgi:hypothetical protein
MFKMFSGSFAIFVLSNHTTCCQTQTGGTVPLRSMSMPTYGGYLVRYLQWWAKLQL